MDIVPVALPGGMGCDLHLLINRYKSAGRPPENDIIANGQLPILIDRPGLAVDVEGGRVESDIHAPSARCLPPLKYWRN